MLCTCKIPMLPSFHRTLWNIHGLWSQTEQSFNTGSSLICWGISACHFMYQDVRSWGEVPVYSSLRVLSHTKLRFRKGKRESVFVAKRRKNSDRLPTRTFDLYYGKWPTWAGDWIVLWMFHSEAGIKGQFSSSPSPKHRTWSLFSPTSKDGHWLHEGKYWWPQLTSHLSHSLERISKALG